MKKRLGRPPLPAKKRLGAVMHVRLTAAEERTVRRMAKAAGMDPAQWLRKLVQEAGGNG
jgi:hypothetical protein